MKLMINHQTHYQYTQPAVQSIQSIKMTPQSNAHQRVLHWDISVPGRQHQGLDMFNNIWITSSQQHAYQQLTIMAQGVVELDPDTRQGIALQRSPLLFLQVTDATGCSAEMLDFARQYVDRPCLNQLEVLSAALLLRMPYTPESTSVTHTAMASFQARQGVCQDHSHVFIAMCRALGIPARYVSGYLYVANTPHLASHAWAEAYVDGAWACFDISNQCMQLHSHIYVAIGRDYWDVAPVRGMRAQGGEESMYSIVQVLAC